MDTRPEGPVSWRSNKEAADHVRRLLDTAGIPLELQVGEISRSFAEATGGPSRSSLAEPVVYSPHDGETYREIDQHVILYEELEKPGSPVGFQLILKAAIECKTRKEIELFAFPQPAKPPPAFPVFSGLAGSQASRRVLSGIDAFRSLSNTRISMVKIADGTPEKICDEDLVYKSAAAVYDFIEFDHSDDNDSNMSALGLLTEYGLGEKFSAFIRNAGRDWLWSLPRFIESIELGLCENFNRRFFGDKGLFFSVDLHLPVVCVNGDLHEVAWAPGVGITGFKDAIAFVTSIRKTGWPGKARGMLLNRTAEAPVMVTNPHGLRSVLDLGLAWFDRVRSLIAALPEPLPVRAPLESHFYDWAIREYKLSESERGYRSDYDPTS